MACGILRPCCLQDIMTYVQANFVAVFTSTRKPPLLGDWSHVFEVYPVGKLPSNLTVTNLLDNTCPCSSTLPLNPYAMLALTLVILMWMWTGISMCTGGADGGGDCPLLPTLLELTSWAVLPSIPHVASCLIGYVSCPRSP